MESALAVAAPSEKRTEKPWTPEDNEQLQRLIAERKSGGEIAAIMGRPRNSIMGRSNRMGLKLLSQQRGMPKPKRPKNRNPVVNFNFLRNTKLRAKPAKLELLVPTIVDLEIPQAQRKTFMELGPRHCRWGVSDVGAPDFFFCGGETQEDGSYCPSHHELCHTNATRPSLAGMWWSRR